MPQYRKLRQRHSILDLCRNPELAAEVTLQPVHRLGVTSAASCYPRSTSTPSSGL